LNHPFVPAEAGTQRWAKSLIAKSWAPASEPVKEFGFGKHVCRGGMRQDANARLSYVIA
jgi:hypothetical protein